MPNPAPRLPKWVAQAIRPFDGLSYVPINQIPRVYASRADDRGSDHRHSCVDRHAKVANHAWKGAHRVFKERSPQSGSSAGSVYFRESDVLVRYSSAQLRDLPQRCTYVRLGLRKWVVCYHDAPYSESGNLWHLRWISAPAVSCHYIGRPDRLRVEGEPRFGFSRHCNLFRPTPPLWA